jgi:RNA polymerase sigma-70 factor (sigma-E family)
LNPALTRDARHPATVAAEDVAAGVTGRRVRRVVEVSTWPVRVRDVVGVQKVTLFSIVAVVGCTGACADTAVLAQFRRRAAGALNPWAGSTRQVGVAEDVDSDFSAYAGARLGALRRSAYLLCGDWHKAEDLAQTTLVKLYVAWPRVRRAESVDAYARATLVRAFLDDGRRRWRGERPTRDLPDTPTPDPSAAWSDRLDLVRALARLPARMRAVIVLRCWDDLSIAETARALDCSEGTPKGR